MGAFQLRRATISSNILLFFLLATHVLCDSDQSQKPTPPSQPADITFRSGPHQNIKHKGPDPLQVGLDAINFQLATTPRGLWFGGNGTSGPHVRTALADSQCGPGRPCDDGSCCSEDGHCGFFPQHCGSGCQSNCHAKAPCGVNAAPGKEHCPLNLCCSYYGWCGTEAVHCIDPEPQFGKTPCQQGYGKCEVLQPPQCGGNSASSGRKIGYYQAFQRDRKCNYVAPGDINTDGFTHLFFAFAFFDPGDFSLRFAHKEDEDVVKEFTALQRPGLQTWLAIGGWDFNEPGPWQKAFHNMVSTQHGRATLIANLQLAILKWKFQGIDIDWEYPGEEKRGGSSEDGDNLVLFVKELRQALGSKYGISITLAPDWGYLQYFKPKEMEPYVDFFGFMGYDLHGQWDSENALGSKVRPHSDITEIERNLRPLWYDGVNPAKINLGMAFYGRTYKLSDPGCTTYGCGFKGAGSAGRCSAFDGVLTNAEITELWLTKGYEQHLNSTSMTKWMVYDNDNWVGFDDPITHHMKLGFADKRCLGGSMYWSVDQDPTAHVSEKRPDKQAGSGDLFGENKDQCPNDRGWETKVCPPSTGDMPLSRDPKDLWKDAAAGGLWCELMTRMKREFTETGGMSADFRANTESQRIAALMGHGDPTNFGCGANPQGGCTTSTACYDARTPAGALILTSMYEVASHYKDIQIALAKAGEEIIAGAGRVRETFAPPQKKWEDPMSILVNTLLFMLNIAWLGSFNGFIKPSAFYKPNQPALDVFKDWAAQGLTFGQGVYKDNLNPENKQETQDNLSEAIRQIINSLGHVYDNHADSLFQVIDGKTNFDALNSHIESGAWCVAKAAQGLQSMADSLQPMMYAAVIQQTWRLSKYRFPAVIINDGSGKMENYAKTFYNGQKINELSWEYGGDSGWLIDGHICEHALAENIHPPCFAGGCKRDLAAVEAAQEDRSGCMADRKGSLMLPGMSTLDGTQFGKIKWLDIVTSAVNGWKANGKKNIDGVSDRVNNFVDVIKSAGNAFAPDASTTGLWNIPVCTETQFRDTMTKYFMANITENWNCNPRVRTCLFPCPTFPCC